MSDRTSGTVCKVLAGGSVFISPDTAKFNDRSASVFAHIKGLQRAGINAVMVGTRLSFQTRPARFEGGKPDAFDLELIAA
jgi:cold shock CspA family protein